MKFKLLFGIALFLIAFAFQANQADAVGCVRTNETFQTGNNLVNYSGAGATPCAIVEGAVQCNEGQRLQIVHQITNLSTNTNATTFIFGNLSVVGYNGNFYRVLTFIQGNISGNLNGNSDNSIHIQRDGTNNRLILGNEGFNDDEIILEGNASAEVAITFFQDLNASVYVNGTYRASLRPYSYSGGTTFWGNTSFYRVGAGAATSTTTRIGWISETNGSYTDTCTSAPADTTKPVGNTSFNITSPRINDIINFTGNITDETGLLYANWTINFSSKLFFNYSFPASTTKAEVSNSTKITCGKGCVLNFTLDVTDTAGNSWQNSTLKTIADTRGTINIGANITTMRINDMINISGNITEPDGDIAHGWATFNRSGQPLYNITFGLSGFNANFSTNFTINLSRDQVTNFTVYYNDTNGTVIQNSIAFTVQNTNPTASNIFNASNAHYNLNSTLNSTPSSDADGDTLTYFWYYNTTAGNYVFAQSGTSLTSWTTNLTDGAYGILVNVSDGAVNISSSYFNFTIDSSKPTFTNNNLTNNTFSNKNMTVFFTCNDNDIFNSSGNLSNSTHTFQFKYNDTPLADSTKLNLVLALNLTGLKDGNYTYTESCGDTHSEAINQNSTSKGKKGEAELVFNDTKLSKEINFRVFFREKDSKLTDNPATLKSYADYLPNGFLGFGVNFTVVKPETKIALNISTNQGIMQIINSSYKSHLRSSPYGIDFNGTLLVNGIDTAYTTTTTRTSEKEVEVLIISSVLLAANDVVIFQSKTLFGLNEPKQEFNIVVDNTIPTPIVFNISGILNNSFSKKQLFNISINATDTYSLNATLFLNDIKNSSVFFQSGINTNLTVNISQDGNYTLKIRMNDTAGNEVNFSYFQSIVIDTEIPTFANPLNLTLAGSNSIFTNTDVNTSVNLSDIYLDRGNFSENCSSSSRTWINHSFTSRGNNTYHNILRSTNFTSNQVCGWKFYAYDLAGNELDPIYTFKIQEVPSGVTGTSGSGGAGSSSSSVAIPQNLANPFGTIPVNGKCLEAEQMYDFKCFPCNPSTGYLKFSTEDRSILCYGCSAGYKLANQLLIEREGFNYIASGECRILPPKSINSKISLKLDEYAGKIAKVFNTNNLIIGYLVIVSGLSLGLYYGNIWVKKNGR